MKMFGSLALFIAAFLTTGAVPAFAAASNYPSSAASANSTSTAASAVSTSAPATKDLDAEVTDIKLRADSGKKRKLSSSVTFTYEAGTFDEPGAASRPALGDQTRPEQASLSGSIGFRYRQNKNESYFLATGFHQVKPFHNLSAEEKAMGEEHDLEIFSPHLGYNRTFGFRDWEISSSVRLYYNTMEFGKQIGEVATAGYSLATLNAIRQTRVRGGVSLNTWYTYYNKDEAVLGGSGQPMDVRMMQVDYGISMNPSIQYDITDKVNAYTSLTLLNYVHMRSADSATDFERAAITQTLGVGYAVVRDFYLSPYLMFEPEKISGDRTLVNVRATINL